MGGGLVSVFDVREIADLNEQLHDDVLCEANEAGHSPDPCRIVATHRLRATCPEAKVTLLVCSVVAAWVTGQGAVMPCVMSCGRTIGECWRVIPL